MKQNLTSLTVHFCEMIFPNGIRYYYISQSIHLCTLFPAIFFIFQLSYITYCGYHSKSHQTALVYTNYRNKSPRWVIIQNCIFRLIILEHSIKYICKFDHGNTYYVMVSVLLQLGNCLDSSSYLQRNIDIYILATPKQLLPLNTIYVWIMTHIRVIFAQKSRLVSILNS